MAARPIALLVVLGGLAFGCSDDSSSNADPGSDMQQTDAGTDMHDARPDEPDAAVDMANAVDRTMVELPPLNGWPVENRILSPEFQPGSFFTIQSPTRSTVRRHVYPETPLQSATARLVLEGDPVELALWGVAGDGAHTASVWIGADEEPVPEVTVELHGITLGDLDGEVTPVVLHPSNTVRSGEGRVWVQWVAEFDAVVGPFNLLIRADGQRDVLVHAPIVLRSD